MSLKYVVLLYFLVPMLISLLTYAVLLDLVGQTLSIIAGVCIAALSQLAFCNMFGLPIRWK